MPRGEITGKGPAQTGQCDSNPQAIVKAARQKTINISGSRKKKKVVTIRKYEHVAFVENKPKQKEGAP
jgi:hypothetical protein